MMRSSVPAALALGFSSGLSFSRAESSPLLPMSWQDGNTHRDHHQGNGDRRGSKWDIGHDVHPSNSERWGSHDGTTGHGSHHRHWEDDDHHGNRMADHNNNHHRHREHFAQYAAYPHEHSSHPNSRWGAEVDLKYSNNKGWEPQYDQMETYEDEKHHWEHHGKMSEPGKDNSASEKGWGNGAGHAWGRWPKGWNQVSDEEGTSTMKAVKDCQGKGEGDKKDAKDDKGEQGGAKDVEQSWKKNSGEVCVTNYHHFIPYVQDKLWGTAFTGYEECGGTRQSPINIVSVESTQKVNSKALRMEYKDHFSKNVVNHGNALEVQGPLLTLHYWGQPYESKEVHFHHPSEHMVDGEAAPFEMHVVSKGGDGQTLAVIALLFDIGAWNPCLGGVLEEKLDAGCTRPVEHFGLHCFDEQLTGSYWSYEGSLTTPPCTENVYWMVMQRRATMSWSQLKVYKEMFVENAREVLPLNGRIVTANVVKASARKLQK